MWTVFQRSGMHKRGVCVCMCVCMCVCVCVSVCMSPMTSVRILTFYNKISWRRDRLFWGKFWRIYVNDPFVPYHVVSMFCYILVTWWYLKSTLFLFDFLTIACLKRNLTSHSNFKKFVSSISKCSWKKHLSLLNINFPQSWGKGFLQAPKFE